MQETLGTVLKVAELRQRGTVLKVAELRQKGLSLKFQLLTQNEIFDKNNKNEGGNL